MSRRPTLPIGRRNGFRGVGGAAYNYRTALGNLVAAWDFARDVTPVLGGVDSILDQSGRGNTLSAPGAGNRPTYNTSDPDFNGQPSATGDGTDDYLRDTAISMGAAFGPGSVILVGKTVTTTANESWLSIGTINATNIRDAGANVMQAVQGTGSKTTTTTFAARAHVLGVVVDGSSIQLYVDGVAEGTSAAYTGTTADGSSVSLFARSDGVVQSNSKIAFAAISLTALSAQQMADFATYARARWGTP